MAGEVEKSISISYKADIKDLISKLKSMPNITEAEAKKMVAALDRQLKQAENAAKKSAEASKKAAQEASRAAARGADDFEQLADSARHAEGRLQRVGESAGDIDRGFSSIGLALRGVNPQLAEAADGLADAMAVTEGLTMSMTALNPVVLAGAAAVGAVALAYMSYQQELEASRQLTIEMRDAQKALNDLYNTQRQNFQDSLDKLGDITDEYAVLTGQIDEYELALKKTERQVKATFQGNIDQQQELIDQRNTELELVKNIMKGNLDSVEKAYALSEAEKETLKQLQLQTQGVDKRVDLTEHDFKLNNELSKIQAALVNEIAKQEEGMKILVGHQRDAVAMSLEIQEYENETAKAKENQVKPSQEIVQAKEDEGAALRELIEADLERYETQRTASLELQKLNQEAGLSENELKELNFQRELERIRKLGEEAELQGEAQDTIDKMIFERKIEREKELQAEKLKTFQKDTENLNAVLGSVDAFTGALMSAVVDSGKANQKVINGVFMMNQASSIAQIAMTTAENVVKAQGYPPPLNGVMTGLALATGAAQGAVVMAQKPPQASFHTGGYAPDEMGARVLKGEAILDRATVRSIGGEQGVKKLQSGQNGGGEVMVIQPFKHWGRFTKEIGYKKPKMTGMRGY